MFELFFLKESSNDSNVTLILLDYYFTVVNSKYVGEKICKLCTMNCKENSEERILYDTLR